MVEWDWQGTGRLQADLWLLWRAANRQGDKSANGIKGHLDPARLGDCLTASAEDLADNPFKLAELFDAHQTLSALVSPATPESIQLSEAYIGIRDANPEANAWAMREARLMRMTFLALTVLAVLTVAAMVGFAFEAVLGQSLVTDTSTAATELGGLRRQLTDPLRRAPAVDTELGNQLSRADARLSSANARLAEWTQFAAKTLALSPALRKESPASQDIVGSNASDSNLAAGSALLSIVTMFVLPVLAGFLGAYCSFARWFVQRLSTLSLAPGDRVAVTVRLALGAVSTTMIAAMFAMTGGGWFLQFWFVVPALVFLCGYLAPRLFGWLDDIVATVPSLILANRVAERTRAVVEEAQGEQLLRIEGSVKRVIGKTLGVPALVSFTGKVGISLRDQFDVPVELKSSAKSVGDRSALLAFGTAYRFEVTLGRELPEMPLVQAVELRGLEQETSAAPVEPNANGEQAKPADPVPVEFEIEVEAQHLTGGCRVMTGPIDPQKPWKHIFELSTPSTPASGQPTGPNSDILWTSVRQSGITCHAIGIEIMMQAANPEPPT